MDDNEALMAFAARCQRAHATPGCEREPLRLGSLGLLATRIEQTADARERLEAEVERLEAELERLEAELERLRQRPPDTATGTGRAPDRYTGHGRETIDRMRDLLRFVARSAEAGDALFAAHCLATALKYRDRAGRKGSADEDRAKMSWYLQMHRHVVFGEEDPRAGRLGFEPYRQAPADFDFYCFTARFRRGTQEGA